MTYQEAIEMLTRAESNLRVWGDDLKIAKKMACEALEKQIPKKPIHACKIRRIGNSLIARDEDQYLKCPNCGCIKTSDDLYCRMCGQAIDWSGEE